jgi:hypothetical protein
MSEIPNKKWKKKKRNPKKKKKRIKGIYNKIPEVWDLKKVANYSGKA